jgi:cytochrome c oxidase subunit 2
MSELLGMPALHSAHGGELDGLINYIHIFMLLLFVGWSFFFIFVLVRFRAGKNPKANYEGTKSKSSKYLEVAVVLVEAVLLLAFSIPLYADRVTGFPDPKGGDVTEVRVVAEQFAWNIHYPGADGIFGKASPDLVNAETNPLGLDPDDPNGVDDITTINQLHMPVDKDVLIHLSSKDVIHCLNLVTMRVKQDAIPGQVVPVQFRPTVVGHSEIACAQLCGLGHYRMRGFSVVHSQDDYDTWMAERVAEKAEAGDEEEEW